MSTKHDALRIIVSKSKTAANQALTTLRAISANSPMVQTRYNQCVQDALADNSAHFTDDERSILSEHLDAGKDERKTVNVIFRLTVAEKMRLRDLAEAEGQTMTDYILSKIFPH